MGFVLFIKSCTIIFLIWFLFYLIISQIKYYSEPEKDIFSGGEAGDIIIERSDGMKEEIKEGYSIQGGLWAENPYIKTVTGRDENNNVIYSYVREKKNKEDKNMREIKVGDKVEIVSDYDEDFDNDEIIGSIYTVKDIRTVPRIGKEYAVFEETTDKHYLCNCKLVDEKEKQFTKSDLKYGDIVELRNGNRYVYVKNYFDLIGHNPEPYDAIVGLKNGHDKPISYYDNNLLYKKRGECEYDIMKILDKNEICKNLKWTLERNKTEMTLEEVCQELGRDIKIVKEH